MSIIYIDGKYLKVESKTLEAFRPGIFKAKKGVFETMLAIDGVVLDAALHLKRLRRGLKVLGIKPPAIKLLAFQEILRRNHLDCARLRLMVWQQARQRHVALIAQSYQVPDTKKYRVCLMKTDRRPSARWAYVKSLDYSLFANSLVQARRQGYDEALLLNRQGHIFEASRANVFWVKDGVLYTPPLSSGPLNGITRQHIMAQAKRLKMPVEEKNLTVALLRKADVVFLTNSLIGIMPASIPDPVIRCCIKQEVS